MSKSKIMEMAQETLSLPHFIRGLFVVTGINFYVGKQSEKKYLSISLNMIEFSSPLEQKDPNDPAWTTPIKMIGVDRLEDNTLVVNYPFGKDGTYTTLMSFQSSFKFKDEEQNKWFQIAAEKFTKEYFLENFGGDYETPEEFDAGYNTHLEDMLLFRAQKQFLIDAPIELGMTTQFYRTYVPKKDGEKYGNTYISKFKTDREVLSGEFEVVGEDITEAIILAGKGDGPGDVPF